MKSMILFHILTFFIAFSFASDIVVKEPWVREPPPASKVAGGFMVLINKGKHPDKLVSVSSPVADRAEIHMTIMRDGRMSMKRVHGVLIKPGEEVRFKPGGYHIMLMGLRRALREGDSIEIELRFKRSGVIKVLFPVKKDF